MAKTIFSAIQSLFSVSDEQAMWRVQMDDDPDAFALLSERYQSAIQNLCTRMLGDVHRAQDLAQETFVRLYARRKEYQPTAKLTTYLWRIALNLCYDELRRRTRRAESPLQSSGEDDFEVLDIHADPAPDPAERSQSEDQAAIIRDALLDLPEAYRTVLVLRHYDDLKFREIADVLGIPEGTVKSRMSEALTLLERKLERALKGPAPARPLTRQQPELLVL